MDGAVKDWRRNTFAMLYMQITLLEESLGWRLKASAALENMKDQTICLPIHDWRLKTLAELHLQIKAIEESLGWHLLAISVLEDESSISSLTDQQRKTSFTEWLWPWIPAAEEFTPKENHKRNISCRDCVEPDDPGFFYGEEHLDNPDTTSSY